MSTPLIIKPIVAQAPAPSTGNPGQIWMFSSAGLLVLLIGLLAYGKYYMDTTAKKMKAEQYKKNDLEKKLKLALNTIRKMETNPDLVHSREFNLDYLRLRMDEEVFHFAIVNQIKIKVKDLISVALRPGSSQVAVGIAGTGRQVDETFDVVYDTESEGKRVKRVLFRIQIKLMKLPTQSTSATISQIIDCIETFLSPSEDHETWQPTIQGRIVTIRWDQKAKPTPLLVMEQTSEGVNVTLKVKK
jgi:hypothetical protein